MNQVRQRITRAMAEETAWALDGDEGVFADADIPDEADKVRELIGIVPEGADRKFTTLFKFHYSIIPVPMGR